MNLTFSYYPNYVSPNKKKNLIKLQNLRIEVVIIIFFDSYVTAYGNLEKNSLNFIFIFREVSAKITIMSIMLTELLYKF